MYRLQRPRRPKDARSDLIENFEALSHAGRRRRMGGDTRAEHARDGAGAGHSRCSLRATRDRMLRVAFVGAIAALDCEATVLDARG